MANKDKTSTKTSTKTATQAKPKARAKKPATINEEKLQAFLGKVVTDCGAAASAALVLIGDKLGLYKAMADAGPMTPVELAARTGTHERYVREWLINQAAGGYVEYDPASGQYALPPEHAAALVDDSGPAYVGAVFTLVNVMIKAEPRILEGFVNGRGMLWGEHDASLFSATEKFFRPGYAGNLVPSWLPALDGVVAKLERGAKVADIGCGHGASTILMAKAFPKSQFYGFDNHAPSIEAARQSAHEAGLTDCVSFEVASAQEFPETGYDFVAFFDCLHDMGDPVGALKHTAQALAPGGTIMLVEPMAGDTIEGNFNPVGRMYSAASVMLCTPNAIASGPVALGTVASEAALRDVATQAGLSRFRRATETPFNRIFEARR